MQELLHRKQFLESIVDEFQSLSTKEKEISTLADNRFSVEKSVSDFLLNLKKALEFLESGREEPKPVHHTKG